MSFPEKFNLDIFQEPLLGNNEKYRMMREVVNELNESEEKTDHNMLRCMIGFLCRIHN
jgi:hypothetical protein